MRQVGGVVRCRAHSLRRVADDPEQRQPTVAERDWELRLTATRVAPDELLSVEEPGRGQSAMCGDRALNRSRANPPHRPQVLRAPDAHTFDPR